MPVGDATLADAERSLRAVLDVLLQDVALTPVDAATLPWHRPIFIVRTLPLEAMRMLLDEIHRHTAAPTLHILSHARDAEAIAALAPAATFHSYPAAGRYSLEEVPAAMLHRLREADFGMLIFPDPATSAELADEIERLFDAIDLRRMVTFTKEGVFARARNWRRRKLAHTAFISLVEWFQSGVDAGSSIDANQALPLPGGTTNDKS